MLRAASSGTFGRAPSINYVVWMKEAELRNQSCVIEKKKGGGGNKPSDIAVRFRLYFEILAKLGFSGRLCRRFVRELMLLFQFFPLIYPFWPLESALCTLCRTVNI